MRYLWSRFIIVFLVLEVVAFIVYYNFGPRGMCSLYELTKVRTAAQSEIKNLELNNDALRDEIEEWKSDIFLQEKFAREKLALQKEDEIIYFR